MIKRFWVDQRGRLDKETMTDPDEIAVIKRYYEDQLDALMEKDLENETIVAKLKSGKQQLQHLIELRDRKINEQKDLIDAKTSVIDELTITKEVLLNDAKEKEREYQKSFLFIDELKASLHRREQANQKFLRELQDVKDSNRALETKLKCLEKEKDQAENDLMRQEQNNGNSSN